MLQAVYEAVDRGVDSARLFFTDFTKGFDLIDHTIDARAGQTRRPSCPPGSRRAFLTNWLQAVRIGGTVELANSEKRSILLGQN